MSQMDKGIVWKEHIFFNVQRKVISYMTAKSWKNIPHVSYLYEPDLTDFFEYFKKNRDKLSKKANISFNTVMLKVISEGLKESPLLNAHLDFKLKKVRGVHKISETINIQLPWLLPDGNMFTPVIKDVGNKNLEEIANYIDDIDRRLKNTDVNELLYKVSVKEKISDILNLKIVSSVRQSIPSLIGKYKIERMATKERKEYYKIPETDRLTPDDIFGGTMLVSNLGSINKNQRGAITLLEIIEPQVFVVGLNAIQDRVEVWSDKKGKKNFGIRQILPICCSFDHRAIDFGQIIPFQNRLAEIFENPEIMKEWI